MIIIFSKYILLIYIIGLFGCIQVEDISDFVHKSANKNKKKAKKKQNDTTVNIVMSKDKVWIVKITA